jgi:PAS domain S-box-containing protein
MPFPFVPGANVQDQQWQELQLVYAHAPVGLALLSRNLRFLRLNEQLAEINGLPAEDHLGRTITEVVPDVAEAAVPVFQSVVKTGVAVVDYEFRGETPRQPGVERIWRESIYPVRTSDGEVSAVLVVVKEVTAEVRAREALDPRERQVDVALEIARGASFTLDFRTGWSHPLPRFRQLYGIPDDVEAITLEDWFGMVHPDDRPRVRTELGAIFATRNPKIRLQYRICNPRTGTRWIADRGHLTYGPDGPIMGAGVHFDVTEEKEREIALIEAKEREIALIEAKERAEAARAEAEAARAAAERSAAESRDKSRLLAIASHDVRQPLHAMGLFITAMERRVRTPEMVKLVASLKASAGSMQAMFDSLLDMTKIDAGLIEPAHQAIDLGPLVTQIAEEFRLQAFAKGLRLEVAVQFEEHAVADPMLLGSILRNLLTNAVRYTDAGGIHVDCRARGSDARIRIADTGPGIPRERLNDIFDEFVRLRPKGRAGDDGLGLGLAIVRRLAALNETPVTVRSSLGRGSIFSVHVPLAVGTRSGRSGRGRVARPAAALAGRRILVVDDQEQVRAAMTRHIEDLGCAVQCAASKAEAMEAVARGPLPDVLVLDLDLGAGGDGVDLLAAIDARTAPHKIPALIVTGSTDAATQARIAGSRAMRLTKPVDPGSLSRLLVAGG